MSASDSEYITHGRLAISNALFDLVVKEIAPGTGVDAGQFWIGLAKILEEFTPRNEALLERRDELQKQLDTWHGEHRDEPHDAETYRAFLKSIGYLSSPVDDFEIAESNVDPEIARVAGPQLVVPLDNARFVLNAANARWGSLYDALYSSDVTPESDGCGRVKKYNPIRGDRVIAAGRAFLDRHFELDQGSHSSITQYYVENGELVLRKGDGARTSLLHPNRFVGYAGDPANPDRILLKKHGLHCELRFGKGYFIGRRDHAGIYDIHIESAVTAIMDCEDSVASVDIEDKIKVYRNWLDLMTGELKRTIKKDHETLERTLAQDRKYFTPRGSPFNLPGRSVMLVRNVGAHLKTDAVLMDGEPVPETLLDAMVTSLCGMHDLSPQRVIRNSRRGSIYIVKPKMHGPEEVALANELFDRVEDALGLNRNTLKVGIMDEERRTSVNLKACIAKARERVVFINTGFLDRTGDDIHTTMEAGPMLPKGELKRARWLKAYEDSNVDVGLRAGFMGKAQIGKGMWAMPDAMSAMMDTKIQHLKQGATTAWVPSPTAATLHALHYFKFDVRAHQQVLINRLAASVDEILVPAVMPDDRQLSAKEIQAELENNVQGILGYVVRWVGQGIGCSKVPDLHDVALMEDCATLRISSQHIANWLHHGLLMESQVRDTFQKMAVFVDRQNEHDPDYLPMAPHFSQSVPFQAALELALEGRAQPNGYTEFILYRQRQAMKQALDGGETAEAVLG